MRRWAARALALGIFVLSASVGLASLGTAPAYAWSVPSPVVSPFTNPVVSTGVRSTGLCTANATGCVVLAGVGAFQGTCWVLGTLFSDPDGCAEGAETLFSFIPGVGNIDAAQYTGPAGIINPNDYSGATAVFHPIVFLSTSSSDRFRVYWSDADAVPAPGSCYFTVTPGLGGTAHTLTLQDGQSVATQMQAIRDQIGSGTPSPTGCTGLSNSSAFVTGIEYWYPDSTTLEAQWIADPGYGSPLTMTYERHCVGGDAGSGATISGSETFTPVAGVQSPGVSLATCQDTYPGSRETTLDTLGDRAGITNPTPMVDVQVGGFTPEQETEYPLCTTGAPDGGCWLDLQKAGKSCFSGAYCAGWTQNITRWQMSCEWGPYMMDIEVCIAKYETAWDLQAPPRDDPTTPVQPEAPPTAGPNPESPPVDPDTETDPNSRSCYADAWSWNPVDWVLVPVKCALIWAFVPNSWPDFGGVGNPLPAGWIPDLPDLGDPGCGAITIGSLNLGTLLPATGTRTLVDTCAAPWPLVRSVSYYGVLAIGLITVGHRAFRATMEALGMAVDYSGQTSSTDVHK